jgi:hypothetical protein
MIVIPGIAQQRTGIAARNTAAQGRDDVSTAFIAGGDGPND